MRNGHTMSIQIRNRARFAFILVAVALLGGCATTPSDGSSASGSSGEVITTEEIRELGRLSAYQVVQRLHPQWLRARGVDSFYSSNGVVVYLDGQKVGGVDALRRISGPNLEQIQRLDSRQATTRFGVGHPAGALMVTTRR